MTIEPSRECYEHHMLLKQRLENFQKEFDELSRNCTQMKCFFFGGTNQTDGHISFVDKVNTMYENQKNNRNLLITFLSVFGVLFISALIGLGVQIHTINRTSEDLLAVVKSQKEIQEQQNNLQVEIAKLKIKVGEDYKK